MTDRKDTVPWPVLWYCLSSARCPSILVFTTCILSLGRWRRFLHFVIGPLQLFPDEYPSFCLHIHINKIGYIILNAWINHGLAKFLWIHRHLLLLLIIWGIKAILESSHVRSLPSLPPSVGRRKGSMVQGSPFFFLWEVKAASKSF